MQIKHFNTPSWWKPFKIRFRETLLKFIESVYDNNQYHTEWGKTETISLYIWKETRMPIFTTPISCNAESFSKSNWRGERNKEHKVGKEEFKFSLFSDDSILYMRKHKHFMKKLWELINELSEVRGYKINMQKPVASLVCKWWTHRKGK